MKDGPALYDALETYSASQSAKAYPVNGPVTDGAEANVALVEALYRKYHTALMRFLSRQHIEHQEAADIAQETYYRISRLQQTTHIEHPQAFLFKTASNLLINNSKYWCHRQSEQTTSIDELELSSEAPSAYRFVKGEQELRIVKSALAQLSEKCQAAFVMHRFEHATYKQISESLGISVSMVEKYISQALAHLKSSLVPQATATGEYSYERR